MSELTAAAVAAAMSEHCSEVFLQLLTLSPPTFPVLRRVNNTTNITSRGNVYTAYPFEIQQPDDSKEAQSSITIRIGNIDRLLIEQIRTLAEPIPVRLELIMASDPDTVQRGPYDLELLHSTYNAASIQGRLSYAPILQRRWPGFKMTPARNPGLFGRTE